MQTVFEGFAANTEDKAILSAQKFGLEVPVAHDVGPASGRSYLMGRYRSGGTPWVVIIDRRGVVRFNGFHLPPRRSIRMIDHLLTN